MSGMEIELSRLTEPFLPSDVEWRVSRAGKNSKGLWAKVLAYITNRAIMERLDEVCGPQNWKNDYREGPAGGVICGIAIRLGDEWVWKWDGAENTDIESVKGGLSGSMKRAAVQWGIGRYLYHLDESWAEIHNDGENYGRLPKDKGGDSFRWDPPRLPGWALPSSQVVFTELAGSVRGLMDLATKNGNVDEKAATKVEEAIDSEDVYRLLKARDWLRTKTPYGKVAA